MSQLGEVDEISTGELLDGRYRLQERIGEGGAARVYRAEDTVLGRTVAVKVMRGPIDGLGTTSRAQSETVLLASLNHHGLVTLFDARVDHLEGSYLVMEYVEGITLRERMMNGRIDPAEVASLAVDIGEALHVAHLAGIVHRDIKPSNILLWKSPVPGRLWRAKIADFGIAHLLDSARVTTPGIMVGTVAYVAPEQARGLPPAPPADVYALGILLIEALTGTRPFAEAEGIGAVMARLQGPPPIPDSLDERWQHLLRGMTAMSPDDRPTALDVAIAASKLAAGEALDSRVADLSEPTIMTAPEEVLDKTAVLPATALDTAARPAEPGGAPATRSPHLQRVVDDLRRRRGMLAMIVVGVLLVAAAVGFALLSTGGPRGAPQPASSPPAQEQVIQHTVLPTPAQSAPPAGGGVAPAEHKTGGAGTGAATSHPNKGPGNNNGNGKGKGKGRRLSPGRPERR